MLTLSLDVTDADAVRDRVAEAEEHFGRLDVVVNNAGYGHFAAVEEVTDPSPRLLLDPDPPPARAVPATGPEPCSTCRWARSARESMTAALGVGPCPDEDCGGPDRDQHRERDVGPQGELVSE